MDFVISLDTEDYLTPEAADAQKWWADELAGRGIRACFQCVGELLRTHCRNGRTDVIESIAQHEIGHHTDFHSRPPTHPQVQEGMSLAAAINWTTTAEAPAFDAIRHCFGRDPVSFCSPGDSWTPGTLLSMAAQGVKVFCNDDLCLPSGTLHWYCGLLTLCYTLAFEDFFASEPGPPRIFEEELERLVSEAPADGVIVLFTHPTRLVTARFWDELFAHGQCPPPAEWHPAPLYSETVIADNKARARRMLDTVQALPGARFVDFETVHAERQQGRRALPQLLAECNLAPGQAGALPLRKTDTDGVPHENQVVRQPYSWLIYPPGFRGDSLIAQAEHLAWTSAPARRDEPCEDLNS